MGLEAISDSSSSSSSVSSFRYLLSLFLKLSLDCEKQEMRIERIWSLYEAIRSQRFTSNGRILINSGALDLFLIQRWTVRWLFIAVKNNCRVRANKLPFVLKKYWATKVRHQSSRGVSWNFYPNECYIAPRGDIMLKQVFIISPNLSDLLFLLRYK